ncbi:hypothetical protein [Nocardiopsis ganjiahuensis]|uniref:hypothetical protein n=1 Tax=Nocardiopsis ganjiahuensis TaxID=239984 RepID=UPI0003798153|nr:hypothetical protein [Nocardiopsis ganjiahuensis]
MVRYLNLSELAYVRHRASELMRRRRRAPRVRRFALDIPPAHVLGRALDGLCGLGVA